MAIRLKHDPQKMIGKKYNKLTVLSESEPRNGRRAVNCKCDCGADVLNVLAKHLPNNVIRACKKCSMKNKRTYPDNDLIGMKFGMLTVIKLHEKEPHKQQMAECLCDCGNTKTTRKNNLTSGNSKSCGCNSRNTTIELLTTHDRYHHRGGSRWRDMMNRCYNENNIVFNNYGGRGISVCEEWHDCVVFCDWVDSISEGSLKGLEIDRINNNGNYSPNNCRFITSRENLRNKRDNVLTHRQVAFMKALRKYKVNIKSPQLIIMFDNKPSKEAIYGVWYERSWVDIEPMTELEMKVEMKTYG